MHHRERALVGDGAVDVEGGRRSRVDARRVDAELVVPGERLDELRIEFDVAGPGPAVLDRGVGRVDRAAPLIEGVDPVVPHDAVGEFELHRRGVRRRADANRPRFAGGVVGDRAVHDLGDLTVPLTEESAPLHRVVADDQAALEGEVDGHRPSPRTQEDGTARGGQVVAKLAVGEGDDRRVGGSPYQGAARDALVPRHHRADDFGIAGDDHRPGEERGVVGDIAIFDDRGAADRDGQPPAARERRVVVEDQGVGEGQRALGVELNPAARGVAGDFRIRDLEIGGDGVDPALRVPVDHAVDDRRHRLFGVDPAAECDDEAERTRRLRSRSLDQLEAFEDGPLAFATGEANAAAVFVPGGECAPVDHGLVGAIDRDHRDGLTEEVDVLDVESSEDLDDVTIGGGVDRLLDRVEVIGDEVRGREGGGGRGDD